MRKKLHVWMRRRDDRKGHPWYVQWELPEGGTKSRTFGRTPDDKRRAEEFRDDKRRELRQPIVPAGGLSPNITIRQFAVEHWIPELESSARAADGLKRRTLGFYRETLAHRILPTIGDEVMREFDASKAVDFLSDALSSGQYKRGTVRGMYSTLHRLFERAKLRRVVVANPVSRAWSNLPGGLRKKIRRRKAREEVKAMSIEQRDRFLAVDQVEDESPTSPTYLPAFVTMARAGLRPGEAYALKISDVRPGELHVRATLAARTKGVSLDDRLDDPKSGHARTVQIGDVLARYLGEHIVKRMKQSLKQGWSDLRAQWLFVGRRGQPLDEFAGRKRFKAILTRAGLPAHFTPHCLRHTWATNMLLAGADVLWVSEQLGHSSVQVTLDWYWWAIPGLGKSYASLLDGGGGVSSGHQPERKKVTTPNLSVDGKPKKRGQVVEDIGADARIRTEDLLITNRRRGRKHPRRNVAKQRNPPKNKARRIPLPSRVSRSRRVFPNQQLTRGPKR